MRVFAKFRGNSPVHVLLSLPSNFQFSQASLSDYADCARRFQLCYLLEQPWPAVQAEPLLERERVLALGQRYAER